MNTDTHNVVMGTVNPSAVPHPRIKQARCQFPTAGTWEHIWSLNSWQPTTPSFVKDMVLGEPLASRRRKTMAVTAHCWDPSIE